MRDCPSSRASAAARVLIAARIAVPHQDDVLSLYARMRLADGYLIASPIYVEDINGTLKTMIDRMAFLCHRPALFGKSAFLFTTSGIGSSRHALATMSKAFGTWGIKTAGQAQFRLGALSTRDEIAARYGETIERDARRFFRQLLRQPFRPSMYSLIAFTVQQSLWSKSSVDHDTVDYRYWRDSRLAGARQALLCPSACPFAKGDPRTRTW